MGHQTRSDAQFLTHHASAISTSRPMSIPFLIPEQDTDDNLSWPFGKLDGLDGDDIREAAYEVFFTSCRSSPGFGGRHALAFYSSHESMDGIGFGTGSRPGSPGRGNGVGMLPNSRIKKALGLKTLKRIPSRRTSYGGTGSLPSSPSGLGRGSGSSPGVSFTVPARTMTRRPLTSAEIMRMHMRVTEESDSRLRKTLMRTFVGQMGRRVETIILPLELLRHLRQSEFNSGQEYNFWQRRQLKILEAGLVLHPSIVLDQHNILAMKLQDIVRACEAKTIDTSKYSETMRVLCDCVVSLAWRGPSGNPTTTCHWADGYPLNVHLYLALLRSIFDLRDETMVLEEVDELVELMKKTWSILGINRPLHNVCFTWVLFQQYVITGQTEPDLLSASFTMLTEVANDAKRFDRDAVHVKALASVLTSVIGWSEKRLLNYHEAFSKPHAGVLENLLPLVLQARKMLKEDVAATIAAKQEQGEVTPELSGPCGNMVDFYIRSSLKNAFKKMIETGNMSIMASDTDQASSETLIELAQATEELAAKERETYSNMLKRWHPVAAGVAALTLHNCYGAVVNQYLAGVCTLSGETINALQRAGKLEKILVQMVVEDSTNCEDGGKAIVREMIPYEVDSIIIRLLRKSIEETLRKPKDYVQRVKETETWNPKSKAEPFAQSAVELMKLAKETVDEFFELPIGISENLVKDLAGGLERIVRDYTTFVASCGTKQSYVPSLPPLTRCNRGSKFTILWRKASCSIGAEELYQTLSVEDHHQHPSTSRGTQRLYIRLNTLHYIVSHLNSLDKTLCLSPRVVTLTHKHFPRSTLGNSSSYFELARASVQGAIHHVAEVAAYRLIFLDSNSEFYESLYVRDVASARIQPALRLLKQNVSLMGAILIDRAQPLAVKAVMKASFDAFLMVLLAGGRTRNFSMSDHAMIEEDAESLKHVFCLSRAGLIAEDEVEREAEIVEGVVALMGQTTEQLVEDFSIAARERSGTGIDGAGQKLPMPPTTAKWNRSDPNTILRILCHRNDKAANAFLKRTFQLPKRR
ncbi:hypothetical protein Nepgr_020717 [Nepenthes gracilis]|uniref:Protein unc-13 homolog n=1 Tax=Nepenthes gracilis TaxID=150966 RepID=A0AAD3SZH1_NEPGR|nr:hypothetical protein Nepgr_020717 [Nepenthes gracilis]